MYCDIILYFSINVSMFPNLYISISTIVHNGTSLNC